MIIGITGRAGSGKSTVADIINTKFGIGIIDLDVIGHQLLEYKPVKDALIKNFGDDILTGNTIDRKKLGDIAFHNKEALKMLNTIMHPEIKRTAGTIILENPHRDFMIVGALIQEIGLNTSINTMIVIDASDDQIIQNAGQFKAKIANLQRSRESYLEEAGQVIENNFDQAQLQKKCVECVKELKKHNPVSAIEDSK